MVSPVSSGTAKKLRFFRSLSMGLLVETGPVVWRGPLVMSALQRLLRGAVWGPLDILIVDTPPGTGDVHLSLSQNVPISGVVLVSSPQTAALEVTKRGAQMYKTLKTPVIGLVENMSFVSCDNCGHDVKLFENVTDAFAKEMDIKVLARVPMEKDVMQCSDLGTPSSLKHPDGNFSKTYKVIGQEVVNFLETNKALDSLLAFSYLFQVSKRGFLSTKLLVQDRNVIIVFSLVEISIQWSTQVVLLSECFR